ncbi:hypothetical protein ESY86_12380 [Subsaximicrobium wynnwilliamsii]|uniref:Uncharacterized protein n=1 Tax=Subsaximicrobium wynnwilliamsii TaxID=291179 RepID=A0A5C6ZEW8_9FLAO|nr:hypothetical protein [Subsaximicrobium wynnwilliamsii]TXD82809.1 hypothetical protein ESY87_12415 [Subsaximicrobium wynnwilliamsii]TXD88533.1 hypothetical protein ESY86_12380 [Subsaximicrobium wynnwilliamsii]TXE02471.1 hypothetical protein ESY88_11985 [Subsaximicrobium wynnwilliamsii]
MKSTEIKTNLQSLIANFSKEGIIYDLLIAYGISKTSVTRLKKGDYNFAKVGGETKPLVNCGDDCTETEFSINRRCEFLV